MSEPLSRTKLHTTALEAEIMKRLAAEPACSAITYVYIKATGSASPDETWMHILISRRPQPRTPEETKALHAVLETMRGEFDLVMDT